ncbi:MAG: S-layer homology domain-containing protein [Clostridia bacterium]|nr:S-layer homology domain-containing protein [Clostridia bacterium]
MKKILLIILEVIIILGISFSFAAESFIDVPSTHWAFQAINTLNKYHIITGYPNGTFKPNQSISRAEFSKIIVPVLDINGSKAKEIKYTDVSNTHWAYQYIKTVGSLYPENSSGDTSKFYPEKPIIRKEVATVLVKALQWENKKYNVKVLDKFADEKLISGDVSEKYIAIAVENGLMNGNANGTFDPEGNLTRAEVAQLIYNVYLTLNHLYFEQYDTVVSETKEIDIPENIKNSTTQNYFHEQEYIKNGQKMIQRVGKIKEEIYNVNYVSSGTNYGQNISLDVVLNNTLLRDGGRYTLNSDDKIYVFINNASSVNNIYYMFSYGNVLKTTGLQRVNDSVAIITVPSNISSNSLRLSISGTSVKDGKIYETSTQIISFNYTNKPKVVEKDDFLTNSINNIVVNDNTKSNNITKELDFIVIFNGDTYKDGGATLANAKGDQKIIVRGKPVSNMQGIRYRWDNGKIEYIEGATGTISIPKEFTKNSKHLLSIIGIEKGGSYTAQKDYTVEISATY